jgi:hypothetical protein
MKSLMIVVVLLFVSMSAFAEGAKPCDDLKAEIVKKIEANGVKTYSLEIVAKDKETEANARVVGTCDGGSKKIVYSRTSTPPPAPAKEASKP